MLGLIILRGFLILIFYKKGWMEINIDAMPGSMKLFNKFCPRDINIEKLISDKHRL